MLWRSMFDEACRRAVLGRLRSLEPEAPRRWGRWPDHALFGRMRGSAWGVFVHKHFDHHLRQFGA